MLGKTGDFSLITIAFHPEGIPVVSFKLRDAHHQPRLERLAAATHHLELAAHFKFRARPGIVQPLDDRRGVRESHRTRQLRRLNIEDVIVDKLALAILEM